MTMNVHKETLKKALNAASFPVLAALLVHFTKDISILDKLPKPKQAVLGETQGFLTPQEKEKIKKIALNEIESFYLNSTLDDVYIPSNEEMHKMMNFIVGENVQKDYIPMMSKELNLNGHDLNQEPAKVKSSMEVLIIGAGMSGILAAIKLAEAGIKYKIYEKNNNLGGTWYENKYPGSRVDIANHFYSYSFEENYQWSEHFSQQPELLEYFKKCFYKYDIQNHTYFGTQVTDMKFDNSSNTWELHSLSNGKKTKEKINIVISCVGQLNQPKIPDIKGLHEFQGTMFHSSQWPDADVISNKKVCCGW
jgi:4-hydroxyacetophenone monooxygenase